MSLRTLDWFNDRMDSWESVLNNKRRENKHEFLKESWILKVEKER